MLPAAAKSTRVKYERSQTRNNCTEPCHCRDCHGLAERRSTVILRPVSSLVFKVRRGLASVDFRGQLIIPRLDILTKRQQSAGLQNHLARTRTTVTLLHLIAVLKAIRSYFLSSFSHLLEGACGSFPSSSSSLRSPAVFQKLSCLAFLSYLSDLTILVELNDTTSKPGLSVKLELFDGKYSARMHSNA